MGYICERNHKFYLVLPQILRTELISLRNFARFYPCKSRYVNHKITLEDSKKLILSLKW
jgi:hypothetical protein